jgi:7-cyano-7-deazaguanine synthase
MKKCVVLLSGGQDSTTCLFWAKREFGDVLALSIAYGQRHVAELDAARKIAALAGAQHVEVALPVFSGLTDSALTGSRDIQAAGGYGDAQAPGGLPTTFVPGRNLLFISVAAAHAVAAGARDIVTGVCQTDYSGYPDCRREFVDSLEHTLGLAMPSDCGPFQVYTPLMRLTKAETVHLARELPGCWDALQYSVTCYHGKRPGCGECPACVLRAKGFAEAGVADPAA